MSETFTVNATPMDTNPNPTPQATTLPRATRDFLQKVEIVSEVVDIPAWGCSFVVKALPSSAESLFKDLEKDKYANQKIIVASAVDPVLSASDLETLANLPMSGTISLMQALLKLNGLGEDAHNLLVKN